MRATIGTIFRGQGVAYIAVNVEPYRSIRFKAVSESGIALPIESYFEKAGRQILVTPLLETSSVSVIIEAVDGDGIVQDRKTKTLKRSQIKWLSRLNYRTSRAEAAMVRDVDRVTYTKQIHINPTIYLEVPDGNWTIVKGVICTPENEKKPLLTLLAGDGGLVKGFDPYYGSTSYVLHEGIPRKETSFTARIPSSGTYCLVASGSGENRSAFMCFDPPSREYYSALFDPRMYRRSAPQRWSDISDARGRKLESASSEDYEFDGVMFSIVVPLFNTPVPFLREMIDSVYSQFYQKWELLLVNSTPENNELTKELQQIRDSRVKVIALDKNYGIAGNTNRGIEAASGDYIVFFDHDDLLDPMALFEYASVLRDDAGVDAIYCDEDFLNEEGSFVAPHFKSDFNLDLLRCHNYITHLLAVRAPFAKELRLDSSFDGAQDYDFLLRLVERTDKIAHVSKVLYHWRISDSSTAKSADNKGYADDAGRRALQAHYNRLGIAARAEATESSCFYHTVYEVLGNPKVSVIIPNKDSVAVLDRCLNSIADKTSYDNFEVIVVENNSESPETFDYYQSASDRFPFLRVVTWDGPFNYSAINNFGAGFATGDYYLLLNNDVEVIDPDWMRSMVSVCQRSDVGVVGAKLLYPDDTVQHAGVFMITCGSVNELGGPAHAFTHLDRSDAGYMRRASLVQDVSIVTGACLMTSRDVFEELNGLDEDFVVAFNDVDYCLRVRKSGRLVVYNPDALLYHYESFSRGSDSSGKNAERFIKEQGKLRARWSEYYLGGDPYFGANATLP
ncbi:glycosyltransferase family 2 protein [Enorma massiliensis]|uniref:glycosyltransferase family 2 protein n=1 Tax=Enorma massiliensis TaxID=1472761 RepID=UPI0023F34173|nr:glycosyltransferase family 2 protein [Enorma massiliensis]